MKKYRPIPLKEVVDALPPARKKAVMAKTKELIEEYENLQVLRKSLGLTQKDVAERLGVNQVNISNLERRGDMQISTLRKYVEALGYKLEIYVRGPGKKRSRVRHD